MLRSFDDKAEFLVDGGRSVKQRSTSHYDLSFLICTAADTCGSRLVFTVPDTYGPRLIFTVPNFYDPRLIFTVLDSHLSFLIESFANFQFN